MATARIMETDTVSSISTVAMAIWDMDDFFSDLFGGAFKQNGFGGSNFHGSDSTVPVSAMDLAEATEVPVSETILEMDIPAKEPI